MLAEPAHRRRDAATILQSANTFVLVPNGTQALANAKAFVNAFAKALPSSSGNVHLILICTDAVPPGPRRPPKFLH